MSQLLDNSADAILFLLYYLLYIGPVMQKGDLFLSSVQRLGKSKRDFYASRSTKLDKERVHQIIIRL